MEIVIVKIGGDVIDDKRKLSAFLNSFTSINGLKILVHGGGKIASTIGRKLGIEPVYADGRRITDEDTLDVVTMVYGGLINKNIVAELQYLNCNAIGLTGADANILPAIKRPVKTIDFGFVGDINMTAINTNIITTFLNAGLVPVFAPLTHDGLGSMLNTNADTIAQSLAHALAAIAKVSLIYCMDKKGVLSNPDDETSVIPQITGDSFLQLKETQVISGGMIPKLENALAAIKGGVSQVIIGHAEDLNNLHSGTAGTTIL